MKDRDVRICKNRLCSAAMAADGTYYPNACQRCKSPCRYGPDLMHHYGMVRAACRLAIAKWDGKKDAEQSKSREALGNIIDVLKKAGL